MGAFARVCFIAVSTALLVTGCAPKPEAFRVLKPVASPTLSQKTFAWANGAVIQAAPKEFDKRNGKALEQAIAATLGEKGYVKIDDPQTADMLVGVTITGEWSARSGPSWQHGSSAIALRAEADRHADRVVGTRSRHGLGSGSYYADNVVQVSIDGGLQIDIQDRESAADLWKGRIRKKIELSDITEFRTQIANDIDRLMKDFPDHGQ